MSLICRDEDAAAHMMRQSLPISGIGSSRSTEMTTKVLGVLIQTVSIALGVCLGYLAFLYAVSILDW
jgi:hypothetical protein